MSSPQSVLEINRALAQRINEEARANPQSPYSGKFVGIANGKVVVVADSWDDVGRALDEAEPDPQKTFCLEASRDYDEVEEIWSFR